MPSSPPFCIHSHIFSVVTSSSLSLSLLMSVVSMDLLWSLVCVVCSLISKEQGVTVVAVCVVYDLFIANQVTNYTIMKG